MAKYANVKFEYGNRPSPGTTVDNMLLIKNLFDQPKRKSGLVTFDDMKKVTGKKWVRGFFNALKIVRDGRVEAVREGRQIVGYRYAKKQQVNEANDNAPRRRGRPPKSAKETPKRRGRPPKAKDAPKRRGRPPKIDTNKVVEAVMKRKRGRPPKQETPKENDKAA